MRELNVNEIEQINGGHPVVAAIGYVIGSTAVRSTVRGAIFGASAYLGFRFSQY